MSPIKLFLALLAGLLAQSAVADIVIEAADGGRFELDSPATRVVTLSPNLAELVFAAGAGARLVATVEYSNFPAQAAGLPRVGDAFRLDIERILSFEPDLVIAWHSGTPGAAVAQLRQLGVPVWPVEIRKPGEIALVLEDIGRATGSEDIASGVAQSFRSRLERLAQAHRGASALEYFYQVDARPLYTINGEHLISHGLALCGGRNIFDSEPALAFQVSHEAVITADPEVLIAPSVRNGQDPFSFWREWPAMQAVKNDALFTLDADRISQATPRWLDSIETACRLLDRLRDEN